MTSDTTPSRTIRSGTVVVSFDRDEHATILEQSWDFADTCDLHVLDADDFYRVGRLPAPAWVGTWKWTGLVREVVTPILGRTPGATQISEVYVGEWTPPRPGPMQYSPSAVELDSMARLARNLDSPKVLAFRDAQARGGRATAGYDLGKLSVMAGDLDLRQMLWTSTRDLQRTLRLDAYSGSELDWYGNAFGIGRPPRRYRVTRRGNVYDNVERRTVWATWGEDAIRERRLMAQARADELNAAELAKPTPRDLVPAVAGGWLDAASFDLPPVIYSTPRFPMAGKTSFPRTIHDETLHLQQVRDVVDYFDGSTLPCTLAAYRDWRPSSRRLAVSGISLDTLRVLVPALPRVQLLSHMTRQPFLLGACELFPDGIVSHRFTYSSNEET